MANDKILREEQIWNRVFDAFKEAIRVTTVDPLTGNTNEKFKIQGDVSNNIAEVTNCKDVQTDESARKVAIDTIIVVNKNSPVIARVGATNMPDRKTILIQPLKGAIKFGFSNSTQSHQITKGNFGEFKVGENIDVWIDSKSLDNNDVAISEYK